jgi:tetratricopeptide (TPR) repeat protein
MGMNFKSKKIIVVGLSFLALAACQNDQDQAKESLSRGKELLAKGDYASAELELKSAIQGDSNLADSYYTMALLNEQNRNYQAMRENLRQAINLAPDNTDARLKLGKVLLLFNDLEGAANEVDFVLNKLPENSSVLSLKAAVLIRQKKQAEALPIIDAILKKDPKNTDAISLKASVYMENEDFDEALSLLEPAIDANTKNPSLHLLKLQLNAKRKDIDAVVKDYEQLIKMYPEKGQLKIALAKLLVYAKKPQEAEDLLRQYVASKPDYIEPKFVLLSLLASIDETRAMTQFTEYAQQYHNKPKELLQLSRWLLLRKKPTEAQELLERIAESRSQPEKLQAKLLLAKMAFQKQDTKTASTLITSILDINSEFLDAKILQARILVSKKNYEEAKTLLTSVFWSNPKSDETIVMLAQIELLAGQLQQADKKFREALDINPANVDALLPVVSNLLKKQNFGYATELLTIALNQKPRNIILLQKLSQIKIVEKDWDGANKILDTMAKAPNGQLIAAFMQGKVFQEQNQYTKAIDKFKQLLQKAPFQLDAMQEMARCYEELKQRPEMLDYLSTLIEQNKNNIPAYLVKSKLYLFDNQFDKSISELNRSLTVNAKVPQIYLALADTYLKQDKSKEAIEISQKGLKAIPGNLKIPLMLASIYKKTGEYKKAAEIYEMLLGKNNNLDIVANEFASLLVDFMGDEESLKHARNLAVRFKNSKQPFYLDTYAWTELHLNNVSEALVKLKKVNELAVAIPVFKYHLGVAYHREGQNSIAISELQQAIELGKKKRGFAESEAAENLLNKLLKPAAS